MKARTWIAIGIGALVLLASSNDISNCISFTRATDCDISACVFGNDCDGNEAQLTIHIDNNRSYYDIGEEISMSILYSANETAESKDVTKQAMVDIYNDGTKTAELDLSDGKYHLTATTPGKIDISAYYKGQTCSVKVTYIDREAALDEYAISIHADQDSFYPGETVQIETNGESSYFSFDPTAVSYALTNNTAEATLRDGCLWASVPGSVTVTATYKMEGRVYTAEKTFTVRSPELVNHTAKEGKVGERVPLTCGIQPTIEGHADPSEFTTITITSGYAQLLRDSKNNYYMIATEPGTVEFVMNYARGNLKLSTTGTIRFSDRSLSIVGDENVDQYGSVYVGYPIVITAILDDGKHIDPLSKNIQYNVLEGNATFDHNKLDIHDAGTVRVQVIYKLEGGVELESNILVLSASYDGNTIVKPEHLLNLNDSSDTFNLITDIDLSEYENWAPIQNFTGTLRGHGHTITGLNIQASGLESEKGLFATMGGTVENLSIEGQITAGGEVEYIGLLCGKNTGTITNVTASGSVTAIYGKRVGGIAGWSDNTNFTDCVNNASVQGRHNVGGLVGEINTGDAQLQNNRNNGTIKGGESVGGLCGALTGGVLLNDNANSGEVTASGPYTGGLIGYAYGGITITKCENTASISGVDHVGGMLGYGSENVSEISFCQNTGNVTGNLYVGGFAGYSHATTMKNLTNNQAITGKAWVGGIAGFAGKLDTCTNDGTLTITGIHLESDNSKVSYVGGIAGYATSAVGCTNNMRINVSQGGSYVGGIAGYLAATRLSDAEFKANTNNGEIIGTNQVGGIFGAFCVQGNRNNDDRIIVEGNSNNAVIIGSNQWVGGIIGYGRGESHYIQFSGTYTSYVTITNCSNQSVISGTDYVGGILGQGGSYMAELSFCTNTGDIQGNLYVGGYAGSSDGTTMRNLNNNNVITGKAWVGGIAGYAGQMDSCENSGQLVLNGHYVDENNALLSYVGGIAGYATSAHSCINHSAILLNDAGSYVGGLVGYLHASRSDDITLFENNTNHGTITSNESYVGGVFGSFLIQYANNDQSVTIKNNQNNGIISGADHVGGIVGYGRGESHYIQFDGTYTSRLKFTECVNNANITGNNHVGGILGNGESQVSEILICSNEGDITGNLYVGGYAGYAGDAYMHGLSNSRSITGKAWVGGIAGYAGQIDTCENSGSLIIQGHHLDNENQLLSYVGGIAGYATSAHGCVNHADITVDDAGDYVAGIVAYVSASRSEDVTLFENNTNHGAVTSSGSYVGGVFGSFLIQYANNNQSVTIKKNQNNGIISGADHVGGIVGYGRGEGHYIQFDGTYTTHLKFMECTNSATITGNDYVGGILGNGADYIETDEKVWATNTVTATPTATGDHCGELYGSIA